MTPLLALAVIAAGSVASLVRYIVSRAFAGHTGFPWAVLTVNLIGSLFGGALLGLAERAAITTDLRLILLTGVCGGLTTFSTFSVETIELMRTGKTRTALLSVAGNLALGVGAAALAYALLR